MKKIILSVFSVILFSSPALAVTITETRSSGDQFTACRGARVALVKVMNNSNLTNQSVEKIDIKKTGGSYQCSYTVDFKKVSAVIGAESRISNVPSDLSLRRFLETEAPNCVSAGNAGIIENKSLPAVGNWTIGDGSSCGQRYLNFVNAEKQASK